MALASAPTPDRAPSGIPACAHRRAAHRPRRSASAPCRASPITLTSAEQQQDRADGAAIRPRISSLPPAPARARFSAHAGVPARDPHRQQRQDHGDVADPVDQETYARADGRDEHAGDGRTDQLRAVHHGGIQRDGIAQVARALRSSRTTNACRAGMSKALISPCTSASPMIHHRLMK